MPNLFTVPAGLPIAHHAARHVLATIPVSKLSSALVLLPTRRACVVMRQVLQRELAGKATLLPRILSLADVEQILITTLGAEAIPMLEAVSPAMSEAEHRYLLAQQIMAFERRRMKGGVSLRYALTFANTLMTLQEQCVRSGVVITQENLRPLVQKDIADHWKQAMLFLGILTDAWPKLEQELGLTTVAAREVALLDMLAEHWADTPPDMPVIAVGSTGSQPSTARLLKVIADTPVAQVILPGLDVSLREDEWASIAEGHPLFHIKQFLNLWPVAPSAVASLTESTRSVWLDVLANHMRMVDWKQGILGNYSYLKLIPCAHGEEEVRVISLLMREALEKPDVRVALVTPDEGLMARVASMMQRYGIVVDRLSAGTLATTGTGSLWVLVAAFLTNPESLLALRSLLHHPLLGVDGELLHGLEAGWYGVNRRRAGQLPRHEASLSTHPHYAALADLVKRLAQLSQLRLSASEWIERCRMVLAPWVKESGQGHEAVEKQLAALEFAEEFGPLRAEDFATLLSECLAKPWRDVGLGAHPRIAMLTPVEARMQQFDRVVLANMQEGIWPSTPAPNPWLNLAASEALGLPGAAESISRTAHDVLMLASAGEVFLTYPKRDQGAPTTRSRFIERVVTYLAAHGLDEQSITAGHYVAWANALDAGPAYKPEKPVEPKPSAEQRPRRLPVTDIDMLFSDPFAIYAKHVLGLRPLKDMDATPKATDFGSIAHKAIEALTKHWNEHKRLATHADLSQIIEHALRDFSDRPSVDLFWRTRLMNGLSYVNRLEQKRRADLIRVSPENIIEGSMVGVTLHGRIDRLEEGKAGRTVVDYKTGQPPSKADVINGRALQLLTYAILLGHSREHGTSAIEYWQLPRVGEEGNINHYDANEINIARMEEKLQVALLNMLDEQTPFLAISDDERIGTDYDGISRRAEWA